MTNRHFRRVHHFGARASITTHLRYCEATEAFREGSRNYVVRERLEHIDGILPPNPSEDDWRRAIDEAVERWPMTGDVDENGIPFL